MKKIFIYIMLFCVLVPVMPVKAEEDLAKNSKSAILIEASTGKVLYEKNADEKMPPASMTKVMSMLLIMEAIDQGKLKYSDDVMISENAAGMGGSQIFLQPNSKMKVEELLKGVAIASGNDAVVALAEKVAGSVDEFVRMMNEKAKSLGLNNTTFKNPHGLDAEGHITTARDMSVMARELIKHQDILKFTSIYEEYLKKEDGTSTWLVNTNKLVRFYEGVDGLKTGFTSSAGYCLTATATRGGMRLISVAMNSESPDKRSADTVSMLSYGFNSYKLNTILTKDKELGKIKIARGKIEHGTLVLKKDATELLKVTSDSPKYQYNIKTNKVTAPVSHGDVVGEVEILDQEGNHITTEELTIKEDIKKANIWDLFLKNLKGMCSGKSIVKK